MKLFVCPACARHLDVRSTTCPFCAAAVAPTAGATRAHDRRLGRVAVAASITAALACGARTDTGGRTEEVASADASAQDAAPEDAGQDTAFIVLYGPAPQDAGVRDSAMQDGGVLPIYGAPPLPDAN